MKSNKYHLFLDETGDHGLSFIDKNFPLKSKKSLAGPYADRETPRSNININIVIKIVNM